MLHFYVSNYSMTVLAKDFCHFSKQVVEYEQLAFNINHILFLCTLLYSHHCNTGTDGWVSFSVLESVLFAGFVCCILQLLVPTYTEYWVDSLTFI